MSAIIFNIELAIKIEKKDDAFISSCPNLDVFSQGETEKEAKNNIIEALTAFFIGCIELNTLERVLKECGFKLESENSVIKHIKDTSEEYVNIPIYLFADSKGLNPCHA
ncbi:MAG: hypothetical protein HQK76_21075 [Desulfobacterales bacterium]|nr:hypothetical protein [Desulfobacterales bacterium]